MKRILSILTFLFLTISLFISCKKDNLRLSNDCQICGKWVRDSSRSGYPVVLDTTTKQTYQIDKDVIIISTDTTISCSIKTTNRSDFYNIDCVDAYPVSLKVKDGILVQEIYTNTGTRTGIFYFHKN